MRVTRWLKMRRHMDTMCGPKSKTHIYCDPPPWILSVGAGAIRDGYSLLCSGFKCEFRVQLWHAEFEEQQRSIRMVREWHVICWVELRFRNWVYGLRNAHLPGRRFAELVLTSPLWQLTVASGLQGWVKGVSISPIPPILLCFVLLLSVEIWSGLDSAFSVVEALAEAGLLTPQLQLPLLVAVDVSAIKLQKPIPSN